jgi:hypothetical protein
VRVERVEGLANGMRLVHLITDEQPAAACPPRVGVLCPSRKDRTTTSPRDIPYGVGRNHGAVEQSSVTRPGGLLRARFVHQDDSAATGANRPGCSVSTRPAGESPAGNAVPEPDVECGGVDPWDTGFVDLAGDQGLLGQAKGRTVGGGDRLAGAAERAARQRHRTRGHRPALGGTVYVVCVSTLGY